MNILSWLVLINIIVIIHSVNSTDEDNTVKRSEHLLEIAQSTLPNVEVQEVANEETRLETLVRAFKRLPDSERERLGVNLDEDVIVGSQAAEKLISAWHERQAELKLAIESMVKPAEHMGSLLAIISGKENGNKIEVLKQLEAYVDDIDNARDFHTIGGWKLICELISKGLPSLSGSNDNNDISNEELSLAAWVMGTAVKSDYDFQLWVLEQSSHSTTSPCSCLTSLLHLLHSGSEDQQKKALYAITSATRGNMDVQQALQLPDPYSFASTTSGSASGTTTINFISLLSSLSTSGSSDLQRKVWSFVSDMMSEVSHLNMNPDQEYIAIPSEGENENNNDDNISPGAFLVSEGIVPLGHSFCNIEWMESLSISLEEQLIYLKKGKGWWQRLPGISGSNSNIDKNRIVYRATIESILSTILQVDTACGNGELGSKISPLQQITTKLPLKLLETISVFPGDDFEVNRELALQVINELTPLYSN